MAKVTASPFARYTRATTEAYTKHRLIGLSYGEPGSRKTSFWLEAPGPIVVMSFDKGLEGVVDRVLRDNPSKQIYVKEYEWLPTTETSQEDAITLRDEFTEDFEHAIQNARTVLIDKETDLWELFRYAEFGAPNDAPRNYPALNQRYRRLVNMPKALDVNVGFVEGMKDEWGSKVNKKTGAQGAAATGNRIRAGFGELDGLVHLILHHHGVGQNDWAFTVGKVRGPNGVQVAGETLTNLTFPEFAMTVFPDSSPEDWE